MTHRGVSGGGEADAVGASWVGSGRESVRNGGCGRGWEFVVRRGGTGCEPARTLGGGTDDGMD